MAIEALGLIETRGMVAAVEAADAGIKAANVHLHACRKVRGGLVTIQLLGDVGAVKASVEAGAAAAARVGTVIATHVIPRPHPEVAAVLGFGPESPPESAPPEPPSPDAGGGPSPAETASEPDPVASDSPVATPGESLPVKDQAREGTDRSEEDDIRELRRRLPDMEVVQQANSLGDLTVHQLRRVARALPDISLSRAAIRDGTRDQLLNAIRQVLRTREGDQV